MSSDYILNSKVFLNKKLLGCPICCSSRYVIKGSSKGKGSKYGDFYCHSCDALFAFRQSVLSAEWVDDY